jgi:hypothetical protein
VIGIQAENGGHSGERSCLRDRVEQE